MPELKLNTVENYAADIGNTGKRIAIGFTIDSLDTGSLDPNEITGYVKTYDGSDDVNSTAMPQMGDACLDPEFPDALMTNILIRGVLPDMIAGQIIYSTSDLGFTPSVYTITRSTRLVQTTTNIINGEPLKGSLVVSGKTLFKQIPSVNVRRPVSTITVEGIRAGDPNYAGSDYVGFVNDDTFEGRILGSWLVDEFTTSISKYTGYHSFRTVILGNILGSDHSAFEVLKNPHTGQREVDPADAAAAVAAGYLYGVIGATDKGIIHYGPYPTITFASLGLV